jgi:predicted enzyme related to lactoylglutathione lyase
MGKKIVHVEFPAQDLDRAEKFWEAVGGWSIEAMSMPGSDKQPIPGVGWFTRCKDTEGNPFGLFQSDESAQMPEGAPGA